MRRPTILLCFLATAPGCGPGSSPEPGGPYDSGKARATLSAALDAWKKGEAKSLARRTPPIRFVDDDLLSGLRLADYRIAEPAGPVDPHAKIGVTLSLLDPRGKPVRRDVGYQVAVEPALAVLRDDP